MENLPCNLNSFLDEARPDRERLRLAAQALAGGALVGRKDVGPQHPVTTPPAETVALKKLVANWRALDKLLEEALACLSGKSGYNRVLKLGTLSVESTLISHRLEKRPSASCPRAST